jgi:adenosine kinase
MSVVVDQEFIDKYGVQRGLASMVTDENSSKLLPMFEEIQTHKDLSYLAGGSTQNSSRGASWLLGHAGHKDVVFMAGSVGSDENGKILANSVKSAGVTPHYFTSQKHGTGRCGVLVVNKERSLVADLAAANDYEHSHFETSEIQEIVKSCDIFYSASFFLTVSPQTSVAIGKHCLENNKTFLINIAAPFICDFFLGSIKLCC